jgi:hypothetical protein
MLSRSLVSFGVLIVISPYVPCLRAQDAQPSAGKLSVLLEIPAGTPLRVYLTKKVRYSQGEVFDAKTVEPIWAFDRVVIPAGAVLRGSIVDLEPVSKTIRTMSILRGDFTPLKLAKASFTSITLPHGKTINLTTEPSMGLGSIYVPPRPGKKTKTPSNSKSSQARRFLQQQALGQANARSRGFLDFVRGPNKLEWLENYMWSRLPYHPEWYRSGTRFDAVLADPLDFGSAEVPLKTVQDISSGTVPIGQTMVRFLSQVDSADAKVGDPVQGVLSEPLFSADHKLALPEGTHLTGKVTLARPARMFHRGGQLRFTFNKVELPSSVATSTPLVESAQTQLTAAESPTGPLAVDGEGTAKTTESKTRFLRPILAGLVAAKSLDNDEGKQATGGANTNYSGQTLGGLSGFGLLGTAASFGPHYIGSALGFYGLAWSVYTTVVSRGKDVKFEKNSALSIRFAAPKSAATLHGSH